MFACLFVCLSTFGHSEMVTSFRKSRMSRPFPYKTEVGHNSTRLSHLKSLREYIISLRYDIDKFCQ